MGQHKGEGCLGGKAGSVWNSELHPFWGEVELCLCMLCRHCSISLQILAIVNVILLYLAKFSEVIGKMQCEILL